MNCLIIPDLHLRWRHADKIIKHVGADEVYFLGDFFDDHHDDPHQIGEMCDWLESVIDNPTFHFTFGNHDIHYAFPNRGFECSGYQQWKYFTILDKLDGKRIWDKFKFYHIVDGKLLLSHAGLHKHWVPKEIHALREDRPRFLNEISNFLNAEIVKGMRNESWIFHAGLARWGRQQYGGLIWCDFNVEFNPVRGLNQVFGHTPQDKGFPCWAYLNEKGVVKRNITKFTPKPEDFDNTWESINLCLDVWKRTYWAVWNGKEFIFGNYLDL